MLPQQQVVTFCKIDALTSVMTDESLYELQPQRGWRWLQRLCFAILHKIGAHHEKEVTTFRRSPQENNDLLKSLLGQQGQWISLIHQGEKAMCIYMGPDEHMDLMRLSDFREMQASTFTGRIETRDRYRSRWRDIPITVVPWMRGAIIVPRI